MRLQEYVMSKTEDAYWFGKDAAVVEKLRADTSKRTGVATRTENQNNCDVECHVLQF